MTRILVVAPTESRRRLVNILRQAGYAVAEADSAQSALKSARSLSPELILMAIVMPESNGLEVLIGATSSMAEAAGKVRDRHGSVESGSRFRKEPGLTGAATEQRNSE